MKKILFPFAFVLFFSNIVFAQEASISEAYRAARLLDSATNSGINYQSFSDEVSKLSGLIDIAVDENKNTAIAKQMQVVKDSYEDTKDFWECKIRGEYLNVVLDHCLSNDFKSRNKVFVEAIKERLQTEPYAEASGTYVSLMFASASGQVEALKKQIDKDELNSNMTKGFGLVFLLAGLGGSVWFFLKKNKPQNPPKSN